MLEHTLVRTGIRLHPDEKEIAAQHLGEVWRRFEITGPKRHGPRFSTVRARASTVHSIIRPQAAPCDKILPTENPGEPSQRMLLLSFAIGKMETSRIPSRTGKPERGNANRCVSTKGPSISRSIRVGVAEDIPGMRWTCGGPTGYEKVPARCPDNPPSADYWIGLSLPRKSEFMRSRAGQHLQPIGRMDACCSQPDNRRTCSAAQVENRGN